MIDVRKRLSLKVDDNMLWDTGIRVLNASKIGDTKQESNPKKDFVATQRQRALLRKMEIDFDDNDKLMSSDVNRLISEKKSESIKKSQDFSENGEYF